MWGRGSTFQRSCPAPASAPASQRCCCVSREGVLKPLLPLRRAQWSSRLAVESCSSLDETGTLNNSRLEMFQNPPGFPVSRYHDITISRGTLPDIPLPHPNTQPHTTQGLLFTHRGDLGWAPMPGLDLKMSRQNLSWARIKRHPPPNTNPPPGGAPFRGKKTLAC